MAPTGIFSMCCRSPESLGAGGDQILYTANASFTGTATFRYVIADVHGGLATGTVTVTVRVYALKRGHSDS